MKNEFKYPISFVCRQTGLTAHQIRAWERRYAAVVPERTASNRRLYSETDIVRLKLLTKARQSGHSLEQLAALSTEDLMRLINADMPHHATPSPADREVRADALGHYHALLTATFNLDVGGLAAALERAAVELTRVELINHVIMPLSIQVPELRQKGSLRLIHEHMVTYVIRSFLWDMIRSTKISALSPKIIIVTPAGQTNELGALMMALLASETGWRALYFGPDMPAEETAAAVRLTKARALALYVTQQVGRYELKSEILKLRRSLNSDIRILIGGQFDRSTATLVESGEVLLLEDGEGFREKLESLLASSYPRCNQNT